MKKQVSLLLFVVVVAGLLALATVGDVAQADSAPVLPPNSTAYGKTYDEWATEWWLWATELPADDTHPLIADGAMDCSPGQEGKVWFLGGVYSDSDTAERECEVPVGKALFFPVVNVLCSPLVGDFGPLPLLKCPLNPLAYDWPGTDFQVRPLFASIDGVEVENLEDYYTLSQETFHIGPLPDPSLLFSEFHPEWAPPGAEGDAATGGYYLLLPPLSKGEHDIIFEGEIEFLDPAGDPFWYFYTKATYNLTVVND